MALDSSSYSQIQSQPCSPPQYPDLACSIVWHLIEHRLSSAGPMQTVCLALSSSSMHSHSPVFTLQVPESIKTTINQDSTHHCSFIYAVTVFENHPATNIRMNLEWMLFWRENSYFSNTVSSWMPVVLKIIEFTDPDPRKNPNLTVIWPDRIGKIEGERLFVFYLRFLWDLTKSFLRGTRWKRARPSIIHWSLALVP